MVKIIADSTCDLSDELIKEYDIDILPLYIHLGDKEYKDGEKITPEDLYSWSDENGLTPKTSAPSIEDAINALRPYTKGQTNECDVVVLTISEDMSTTANVVRLAAAELEWEEHVRVIDSMSLSTGIGLLVMQAAKMAKEGCSIDDIEKKIKMLIPKVRASFVVDTLVYLHRGGRCSSTAALFGTMLKLKPKIVVDEGKMGATKKYRGKLQRVIIDYVKDLEPQLRNAYDDMVFITHSGCDSDIIDIVKDYLKGLDIFKEIYVTRAGGVISSHCGPGTLGVLFIEKH